MTIEVFDARFAAVAATQPGSAAAVLEQLCTGAVWSEGPVWMAEDQSVLFSDIPNNRMLRWHASTGMTVWRSPANFTNGHALDATGALLHASHGQRAIVRTRFAPQAAPGAPLLPLADEVLVSHHQGRRLNSPNDLVVKRDGSIWFTDPPYGIVSDREGYAAPSEIGSNLVYRYCPRFNTLRVVSDWLQEPNGLAFSPDERVLYVTDTSAALRTDGSGHHHIVAFDVVGSTQEQGDLANPRVFATVRPGLADGIKVDVHGFVYTSSQDSVQVYHPDGTRMARIAVPEKVGNLVFGGVAGNELFICASTSLYRIVLNTRGATAAVA
jgi:gluconolactonase